MKTVLSPTPTDNIDNDELVPKEADFRSFGKGCIKSIERLLSNDEILRKIITPAPLDKSKESIHGAFVKACFEFNIDPDIVVEQQQRIFQLQAALDVLGRDIVGCNFSEYARIKQENEALLYRESWYKQKLHELGYAVNDYDDFKMQGD